MNESDVNVARSPSTASASKLEPALLPHCSFPASIEVYASWGIRDYGTLHIRDAEKHQRLYAVKAHTGISGRGPLLSRPGFYLHNGPTTKDAIIAAVGDESMTDARVYAFNAKSVLMLPPLEPTGASQLCTSSMWPMASSAPDGVVFQFIIEVGEQQRRTLFEWRRLDKADPEFAGAGGFRLLRLAGSPEESRSAPDGQLQDGEAVAVVTFISMLKTFTHAFSLDFQGPALSGELGDRCRLAIAATAVRLWVLRSKRRTHKTFAGV